MFAAYRTPTGSYRSLSVETSVTDANPHRLISMLYDGAIESVLRARGALSRKDVPTRVAAITRAIRIVDEGLKASLDPKGGQIAVNLRELYIYINHRLLTANLNASDEPLAEVAKLLGELRDGWAAIARTPAAQ